MAAMTAKPRDQSIQKRQKSVSQAKFSRQGHFSRQKCLSGNFNKF